MLKWSFLYSAIAILPLMHKLAEVGESQSQASGVCFILFPLLMLSAYFQAHLYKN